MIHFHFRLSSIHTHTNFIIRWMKLFEDDTFEKSASPVASIDDAEFV